jgi:hypothetical protein
VFSRIHHASTGICWGALLLLVVFRTPGAYAQSALEVELTFTTAPSLLDCPSEATFRNWVREHVGYDPFRAGAPHRILAHARPEGEESVGAVSWHLGSAAVGERELRGRECHDVVRAMAFAVAIQVQLYSDQELAEKSDERGASTPSDAASTPASASPAPQTAEFQTAEPRGTLRPISWLATTGVGVGVRLRSDPFTTMEGRMFGGLSHDTVGGELAVGGAVPKRWGARHGAGFDYWSLWSSVAVCLLPRPLAGCATGRLERLEARGTGVDVSRTASAWLVEVGPRIAFLAPLSPRWQVNLYIEARAVLSPARIVLDDTQVWKSPTWSLMFGADLAAVWNLAP